MKRFSRWLGERPHRATVLNVIMLSVLLALSDSASLYWGVGGIALVLAGGHFLIQAFQATANRHRPRNFFQLALTWVPGVLAILLAIVAITLVSTSDQTSAAYMAGMLLYTVEIAVLALAGADLSGKAEIGELA
ncbi:hypothetical protein [Elstera sp.]|jgi:peptidoglycan/LPS O-acetylase OafA/YrhL|uniref:hypothetical protein n=1 Tax=Elstera sp. TaxID=1916664 RepID=UPI0037BE732E